MRLDHFKGWFLLYFTSRKRQSLLLMVEKLAKGVIAMKNFLTKWSGAL